jgi:PAS domain S-box-containing protein
LQKQIKTRIFNKKTTAIFINILDETGRITKVSKNLPAVLGHSPSDLLGKSINEIIPFTIQPFHDDILIKFVERYSKKTMRSDPKIQFFAYNKNFHLQECAIRYNFVMSYFETFQLSGVCRKVEE